MSSGRKQTKKRKRPSTPILTSQIARRLAKLRGRHRDLWADDDDDDDDDGEEYNQKQQRNSKAYIVLSDSDEEEEPERRSKSRRLSKSCKSRRKRSHHEDDTLILPSTREKHVRSSTCLICSVLSQLSTYNCCAKHLSALKNHHQQTIASTNQSHGLPNQVMVIPLTDEIIQRYLDPQQIHRLQMQTTSSRTSIRTPERRTTTLNKSTMTMRQSEIERTNKNKAKSPKKSCQIDVRPSASSISFESAHSNSVIVPNDSTVITLSSPVSVPVDISENPCQLTTTDTIIHDEIPVNPTIESKTIDPWNPISDEVDAALEVVLNQIETSSDTSTVYTPITVRRTETELMAARLPKIPLKPGRFRLGKPISPRPTFTAANEYRPLAASPSSLSRAATPNAGSPLAIEHPSTSPRLSNVHENTNNLLTQYIANEQTTNSNTTLSSNELSLVLAVLNETEDNGVTQSFLPTTTTDRTLAARLSFRMNPDGTRVSISRPALQANGQSPPLQFLRRTSTDVTPKHL